MGKKVKIQYIYHSGFAVELEGYQFIFDYYKGQFNLLKDKKGIVFASHGHHDHYNPAIFDWQQENSNLSYILSKDIELPPERSNQENFYWLAPYEEVQLNGLQIKTYGSTDEGVSFLVKWAGITIFHAGDLNWWHWWGDPQEERDQADKDFKQEIAKIKGEIIDLAFFPVDPRLDYNYNLGADYFIQEIGPKILIPMHFGEALEKPSQYVTEMEGKNIETKLILLTKPQQEIELKI